MLVIRHYLSSLLFLLLATLGAGAQEFPYRLDPAREAILLGGGGALSLTTHLLESKLEPLSRDQIVTLQRNDVWFLDRGATRNESEAYRTLSDDLLRAAILLPGTLLLDREPRRKALVLGTLLAETMLLNDGLTKASKILVKRSRPLTYNLAIAQESKTHEDARQSFVSGHTSNTAALTFFTAKVFHDLYPDSPWRPVVWAGAATLPLVTGYARYRAGKHFPTDIAAGYALGAALGILIPQFHKATPATGWQPGVTENGVGLLYRW